MEKILDLYTDYLLSSFGQTSATALSKLVDDAIKHDTDENDLINLHWDHSKKRSIKGINLLSAFYFTQSGEKEALQIPVAFETVKKTVRFCEVSTNK